MKKFLKYIVLLVFISSAMADLKKEEIEYKHGDVTLKGYLVYDGLLKSKRPGILVIHEWWGHNEYARIRADQLAEMGYIVFALDMYGKGILAETSDEASELAGQFYENRQLMRDRAAKGLEILINNKRTDTNHIAVIGFCFGGTAALELARSGAVISGAVSFHGGLSTPNKEDANNIRCPVLVLHGGDDPHVGAEEVAAFQEEMRNAGVDWQMQIFGNAVHSFTNPKTGTDNSKGSAYNAKAFYRSWSAMKFFFDEIFR